MNKFHNLEIYRKVTLKEMLDKLNEEVEEVGYAITINNKENMKEEICDVIQCWYGIAYSLGIDINECIESHNKKLLSRGHEFI